jgi:hypothetical protein
MRRKGALLLVTWTAAFAWLGCNALLGIESAVFEPDGGGGDTSLDTGKPSEDDSSTNDGSVAQDASDASPNDAADAADVIVHPCTSTFNDTFNCGACGHDCLGGACSAGRCEPVVLANEPGEPGAIAVDATHVYWTNAKTGDVRRAPIAGGAAETIYNGATGLDLGAGLVRSGADVYFTIGDADGGVFRCPATGCAAGGPVAVVGALAAPAFVGLMPGGVLVFSEGGFDGRIGRCTLPCASGPTFVSGPESFPKYVAASGNAVYWSTLIPGLGNLRTVLDVPGDASTLVAGPSVQQIETRGTEVVFAARGSGMKAVPLDGGTQRRLYEELTQTERFVVDGTAVYFSDTTSLGRIMSCDVTGCGDAGKTLASTQLRPWAIAVDKSSIYWTNLGDGNAGTIVRLAK